ncbi:MAG: hypothetical protein JO372_23735, partial [Solirubrobacterales bacterium]|nr:hypothetical protein [Solirubrobacterales bacterium]
MLLGTMIAGMLLAGTPGRSGAGLLGSPAAASAAVSRGTLAAGQAVVTVPARAPLTPIPRAFLGLSTEYATLPLVEQHTPLYERVLSLLHVPGDGRFVLRIGGDSADHAIFDSSTNRLPPWAFPVTPALVART